MGVRFRAIRAKRVQTRQQLGDREPREEGVQRNDRRAVLAGPLDVLGAHLPRVLLGRSTTDAFCVYTHGVDGAPLVEGVAARTHVVHGAADLAQPTPSVGVEAHPNVEVRQVVERGHPAEHSSRQVRVDAAEHDVARRDRADRRLVEKIALDRHDLDRKTALGDGSPGDLDLRNPGGGVPDARVQDAVEVLLLDHVGIHEHQAPDPEPSEQLRHDAAGARAADDGDAHLLEPARRAAAERLRVPQGKGRGIARAPRPVLDTPSRDLDRGERLEAPAAKRAPAEACAVGQHDDAGVGKPILDPAMDGVEERRVRAVVRVGKLREATGMAVQLHDGEVLATRPFDQRHHPVGAPLQPVWTADDAVGEGDENHLLPDERVHVGRGGAAAQHDGGRFAPVCRQEVRPKRGVLLLGHAELGDHVDLVGSAASHCVTKARCVERSSTPGRQGGSPGGR